MRIKSNAILQAHRKLTWQVNQQKFQFICYFSSKNILKQKPIQIVWNSNKTCNRYHLETILVEINAKLCSHLVLSTFMNSLQTRRINRNEFFSAVLILPNTVILTQNCCIPILITKKKRTDARMKKNTLFCIRNNYKYQSLLSWLCPF